MAEIYDTLGERMKALELRFTKGEAYGSGQVVIDEHKCCIIRVDGRAFHTYTRPFAKQKIDIGCPVPARTAFHPAITGAMKYAMEALIAEFNPIVAYTQSDEITVVIGEDKVPFGRKCHKLNSIAASIATAAFNEYINTKADRSTVPEARYPSHAIFDARSYEATYEEAALTILWRHNDCVKNSISTLARSLMPQSRLVGKKSDARKEMMEQHFNVSWDDLPHGLKYGFLAYRATREFTVEELLATRELPEKAIKNIEKSGGKVIRNYTKYAELPPLNQIANLTDVLSRFPQGSSCSSRNPAPSSPPTRPGAHSA